MGFSDLPTALHYRLLGHSPKTGYIADIAVKQTFFSRLLREPCLLPYGKWQRRSGSGGGVPERNVLEPPARHNLSIEFLKSL